MQDEILLRAETEGFEPPDPVGPPVFKTGGINHSHHVSVLSSLIHDVKELFKFLRKPEVSIPIHFTVPAVFKTVFGAVRIKFPNTFWKMFHQR